jgi:type I restriction enzyme S subunit
MSMAVESILTPGWKSMKLRDVCELINGRAYKQSELLTHGKYRVLRVGNFFTNDRWYYSDLELEKRKYCEDGDLLYAWSASFGPRIWTGGKVIFHYHIWRVVPNAALIDQKFLFLFFLWDKEQIKEDQGTGTTMIHVSKTSMEDRDMRVPPLPEQRHIAARLESLLGHSKTAKEELARIPHLVERYKRSILAAAFRGDLTADWRTGDENWSATTLGDLCSDIRYGTAAKCHYEPKETPVLRIPNVVDGRINTADIKYGRFNKSETEKLALRSGDILVIRSNGSLGLVGRAALVTEEVAGYLYAGYLIRLRVDAERVNPKFVQLAFEEPVVRQKIEGLAKSTSGVNNINSEQLKALSIPLPNLPEQSEIVRRVEGAFAQIDRVATETARAALLLDHLDQSTLAKAFRGELISSSPAMSTG